MVKIVGVIFWICHLGYVVNSLECLQCTQSTSIDLCTQVTTCNDLTEECFLERVTTPTLSLVWNGGCRAKQVCKLLESLHIGRKRAVTCTECCDTTRCNANLCRTSQRQVDHCAICKGIEDVHGCGVFKECMDTESCALKMYFSQGKFLYDHQCEANTACASGAEHYEWGEVTSAIPGKRSNFNIDFTVCEACCKGEHCNTKYSSCPDMRNNMTITDYKP